MKTNQSNYNTILETLSAYLDGQLEEREVQVLRQRLETDAALRSQLDDLRQTRYVLRHTPKLKRRRSFILSAEVVRQQKSFFQAMTVSRMVSAAASVLLVVFLGSQYLLAGRMGLASAPVADSANYEMAEDMPAEEPMMMMEAQDDSAVEEPALAAPAEPAADAAEEPVEAPVVEPEEAAASEMIDATEEAANTSEADSQPPAAGDEPAETAIDTQSTQLPSGGGGAPPSEEAETEPVEEMAVSTATLGDEQRSIPSEKDVEGAQDGDQLGALAQDLPEEDQIIPADEWETGEYQPRGPQLSPIKVVEGVLLLFAIAGALAAAYFRKKVR